MTIQQNPVIPRPPARFLWLTFDFAHCLSTNTDDITPPIFLTLMAHPAINQIKRFTATADQQLNADEVAQWAPGIFTVQAQRTSLLEVLNHVSSQLSPHLMPDGPTANNQTPPPSIKIYTQIAGRHYPVTTSLSDNDIQIAAEEIEAMVQHHEQR